MALSKGWLGFFFVLLLSFLGLVAGTTIGGVFFVPPGSGLAGPVIALGYGVLGLVIALAGGIVLARKLHRERLRRALLGAGLVSVLVLAFLTYRFMTNRAGEREPASEPTAALITTTPAPAPKGLVRAERTPQDAPQADAPLGVGMAKPHLASGRMLYFYSQPDFDQMPAMMTPTDSLVFGDGPGHVDITSAPPWFWPEVMKLDYDLLYLRARTLTKNWIEVVVNHQTGRTAWIDRQAATYIDWPTFLLDVAAVEVQDAEANPIRVKPLDHAGIMAEAPGIPLPPLAIQGSWLQVSTAAVADRMPPTGWIRWRNGDRLVITFSLLS